MPITAIRDAVAVTVPASAIEIPAVAVLLPSMWLINIAAPLADPTAGHPHMTVAAPIPITWHPNVAAAMGGNDFMSEGWRTDLYR